MRKRHFDVRIELFPEDQARYCGVRVYFGSVMSGSYVGEYVRKMLQDTTSAEPRMLSCHQVSGLTWALGRRRMTRMKTAVWVLSTEIQVSEGSATTTVNSAIEPRGLAQMESPVRTRVIPTLHKTPQTETAHRARRTLKTWCQQPWTPDRIQRAHYQSPQRHQHLARPTRPL